MGGGAGVSVHGRFRVATEKTLFAMPETGIGFFPDVGATHFLPTTVGRPFGTYLALTGARLNAAELLEAGLATHFVPSDALAGLEAALQGCDGDAQVAAALAALGAGAAPPAAAPPPRDAIERCFGPPRTAEAIVAALEAEARVPPATPRARPRAPSSLARAHGLLSAPQGGEWEAETLASLRRLSPTAIKVTLRLLHEAEGQPLAACLRAEFRASQRFMDAAVCPLPEARSPAGRRPHLLLTRARAPAQRGSDFFEGIRAALVDKDRKPVWAPATLEEVSDSAVDEYFAPLGERELRF